MTAAQIRPEQARELLALNAAAKEAERTFAAALRCVLAGVIDVSQVRVQSINDDGTVTYTVEGE